MVCETTTESDGVTTVSGAESMRVVRIPTGT